MGMDVKLTDDGRIIAKATTGNKQWVAKLTGTHPSYNYEREFIAYQKPRTTKRDRGEASIEEGDIIEKVRYTHSGKNNSRWYYIVRDGELEEIDRDDVTPLVEGRSIEQVSGVGDE